MIYFYRSRNTLKSIYESKTVAYDCEKGRDIEAPSLYITTYPNEDLFLLSKSHCILEPPEF